ncbi:MAG: outer membrane lipoprotein-sorting protein [Fidelibacterota bacterium]|nr:MAG: outer membrane lipoprotein-sorting protein [Candidatus Neomarinimicrobiota bacterium]
MSTPFKTKTRHTGRAVAAQVLVLVSLFTFGYGQELTGRAIMEQALQQSSWDDMQADMQLILRTARGEKRFREVAFYSKDTEEDLSQMLMRFLSPADVKGTGFLTLETADDDEERYLYLPALRRVKKIAASGSGGNFMSSDYTYYDIGEPKLDDWTYELLGEEARGGRVYYKLECKPANREIQDDTGYGMIVRWVDQENYRIPYSEIYDRALKRWKTLDILAYARIRDTDFASVMIMRDLESGHSSEIRFDNIRVDQGLPDDFFTVRYLQRGR